MNYHLGGPEAPGMVPVYACCPGEIINGTTFYSLRGHGVDEK